MSVTTATGQRIEFDLAGMPANAQAAWLAVYELGVRDGWSRGYAAAEAEFAELHRRAHAVVHEAAGREPYDVLADRRGDHRRAHRQRELLAERGIA